jgi:hypothetical protein
MNARTRFALLVAVAALCVLVSACFPEFDPVTQIQRQRILGIKAEPPEAAPGESVTLTALVANEDGTPYQGVYLWGVLGVAGTDFAEMDPENFDPADLPGGFGIQAPGDEPYAYPIPEPDDRGEVLGIPYRPDGILLTAILVVVEGSTDEAEILADLLAGGKEFTYRFAYKTLIVSDRPEGERNENPANGRIDVLRFGQVPEQDADGNYLLGRGGDANLTAVFDGADGSRVTFAWFNSTKEGFDGQGGRGKVWSLPDDDGVYYLYVVCRNNYLFESDQGYSARSSGMDWATVSVRVGDAP